MKKSVVLLYSGGIDSTVLLYDYIKNGYEVHCIIFRTSNNNQSELDSAIGICREKGVLYSHVDILGLMNGLGAKENYSDIYESLPNIMGIMLSIAASYAITQGIYSVAHICREGNQNNPQESFSFLQATRKQLSVCNKPGVHFASPYYKMSEAEIIETGLRLKVPFDKTWSCRSINRETWDCPIKNCQKCLKRIRTINLMMKY